MHVVLFTDPVPCPRPRVGRHGAYYPARYRNWKDSFRKLLVAKVASDAPIRGPVTARIRIFVKRPRKTSLGWPKPDVDNYAKAVMDACNGVVWEDDAQVIELRVDKQWAEMTALISIEAHALDTSRVLRAVRGTT